MSHTPGPWEVHGNVGVKGGLGIVADGAPCVICHSFSENHWPVEARANARLIAAAPELLAACKEAGMILADISHYVPDSEFEQEPNVNTIREALAAAIAKAEGK